MSGSEWSSENLCLFLSLPLRTTQAGLLGGDRAVDQSHLGPPDGALRTGSQLQQPLLAEVWERGVNLLWCGLSWL